MTGAAAAVPRSPSWTALGYVYVLLGALVVLAAALSDMPEVVQWFWWAQTDALRAAMIWFAAGIAVVIAVLWKRGASADRFHAKVLCALMLVGVIAAVVTSVA